MLGIADAMRRDLPHDARRHIHDLLDDPIAQKLMNADKVDADALLAVLVRAASKLKQRYPIRPPPLATFRNAFRRALRSFDQVSAPC